MTEETVILANLDAQKIEQIRLLEQKVGACLVAYERKGHLANLTPSEVQELKSAEEKLDIILLAYECR
jgi:hypothetical protein